MAVKKSEKGAGVAKKTAEKTPAPKKAAVKKAAAEKAAPAKKAPAKKAESLKVSGGLTRVIAKVDAGWGNSLFIRGNGAGLSWHAGVLMQCVGSDEWIWENKIGKGTVEFKVLVNDEIWAVGDDVSVNAGDTVTCHPVFQ